MSSDLRVSKLCDNMGKKWTLDDFLFVVESMQVYLKFNHE
ncbi:hypothetical protein PL10110_230237 [Planktothrix agardhii]|nr:hypothetical protein PL10110_230237 [Planktothrix agardhii]